MITGPDPSSLPFDYGPLTDEALNGYIERPSIEEEISRSLFRPPRLCVVVGAPGSGKTSLAASMIHSGEFIHHFLRKGHVEFGLWRDPYAFLTSIGFQLLRRFGDSLFPQMVRLDLRGRVHDVERGAAVVGADVQQLVTVPWHTGNWKVRLEANRVRGEAVGVRIGKIVADYRGIPLATYRRMALVDPLLRLQQLVPERRVVLWVDGLDEEQLRPPGSGLEAPATIGDVLPTVDELEELRNLSLVISSRRGPHLDRFTDGGATLIALDDARFAEGNADTIQSYLSRNLREPAIRAGLELTGTSLEWVREELATRVGSNLLYMRHFFEAVRQGEAALVLAGGLPTSLDDIYVRLIRRTQQTSPDFLAVVHPILSTLVIAYEALTTSQLARFTGLDTNVVNHVVSRLLGFLHVIERNNVSRYSLYHSSFAQTLTGNRHRDETWFINVPTAHTRLATFYVDAIKAEWHDIDDYGFDFAVDHVVNATELVRRELLGLFDASWRRAKRQHYGSHQAFEDDLDRGSRIAMELPLPEALTEIARLAFMRALIHETDGQVPLGALEVFAAVGEAHRALGYIRAGITPAQAVDRISHILRGLTTGRADSDLVFTVLSEGIRWATLGKNGVNGELLVLMLLEACPEMNDPAMADNILAVRELLTDQEVGFWTYLAAVELGRLTAPLDPLEATRIFESIAEGLTSIHDLTLPQTVGRLIECWSALDPRAALSVIAGRDIPLTHEVARGLFALAKAFEGQGDPDQATALRQMITTSFIPNSRNPYNTSRLLTEIARSQAEQGDLIKASATINEAVQAAEWLCEPGDDDVPVSTNRKQYPVALAYAADVQNRIDREKTQNILRRAWTSLKEWGFEEEWKKEINLQTLVRAQYRADPKLLQAHIESIDDVPFKAQVLVAAARETAAEQRDESLELVEDALLLTERPRGASALSKWQFDTAVGLRDRFYMRLAHAVSADDRTEAEAVLSSRDVSLPNRVRWRLGVLTGLVSRNEADASDWLAETVRLWADAGDDRELLFEVPALLSSLPEAWGQDLLRQIDAIASPAHRVLLAAARAVQSYDLAKVKELSTSWEADLIPADAPPADQRVFLPDHQLLAFLAGQLYPVEPIAGQSLWIRALLRFRALTFHRSNSVREAEFCIMLKNMMRRDPAAALPALLTYPGSASPEMVLWRVPTPHLSPYVAAGMAESSYLLALALGEALGRGDESLTDHLSDVMPPSVRSLACSAAARLDLRQDVEDRLAWCEEAIRAANEVQPDDLSWLLMADAATALNELGVKQKSWQLSQHVVQEFLQHRGQWTFYSARDAASAHALGKSLENLVLGKDTRPAMELLWRASALGREGLWIVLSYMPMILVPHGTSYLRRLRARVEGAHSSFAS